MKIQRFKVLRENFLEERDFSNSPRENLLNKIKNPLKPLYMMK